MNNSDPHYGVVRWIEVRKNGDRWSWAVVTDRGERAPHVGLYDTSDECVHEATKAVPYLQVRTLA